MSAKKFIAELERRKFLSDRVMTKLRDSLAGTDRPLSAEALAKFLVQKKQLSDQQAAEVLKELTQSGVNLVEEDADKGGGGGEDSSIFAAHVTGRKSKDPPPRPPSGDDDEFLLAPIDDEPKPVKRSSRPTVVEDDDDIPVLGVVTPPDPPRRRSTPTVPMDTADAGLLSETLGPVTAEETSADMEDVAAADASRKSVGLRKGGGKVKKRGKPVKGKKAWDSALILFGGGGLVVLILAGGLIYWLLTRESGDQKLEQARSFAKNGAYAQAIESYKDFLDTNPRHPGRSLARVEMAMVNIRLPKEGGDFKQALATAESELKEVEDEDAFDDAHPELAALLPEIAIGLAKQAETANPTSDEAKEFVEQANKAIALCNNVIYLPKPLRDEGKLTNVRDTLQRVERRQQSQQALAEGLKAMEQALTDAKPIAAYTAHMQLMKDHPELAKEAGLIEALKKTAAAEQKAIKFVSEQKACETKERPTPWVAALAVANHRVAPPTGAAAGNAIASVRVDGAVYGLNAATGQLLWRRHVGYGTTSWPIVDGAEVIVADTVRNELLRLDGATGKLVWRQAIGEKFVEPLVVGDRGFVAAESGKLYVVDLKSGARTGFLQCTQPLRVAPAIDRLKAHLYLAGDRSSLYSISLADMSCIGVYFLGQAPGTIQVPPVAVMDKLAVVENNGVETSRLHLLAFDDKGAIAKEAAERRLNGLVASPPLATGRGLIAVTDRGQIEVYDIATGSEGEVLTLVATRDATSAQPLVRYFAVTGKNIWIADTQLTKYSIIASGNRLPVEEIVNNFAGGTFDHPLMAIGDLLVSVHRPKDRAGSVIAATDLKQGRTVWETDVAVPPAGAPVVDDASKTLAVANAEGHVFKFDEAAIRSRVQDKPLEAEQMPPQPPALTAAVDLGQGRAAFCGPNSDKLLLYTPVQGAKWIPLEGPLASVATPFGQGFLAPLKMGQVFYLSAADGARVATPFQPRIAPQATLNYKPAGAVGADGRQFVITDGGPKIYLVALADQPQPHLELVKEADVGPHPIDSPVVVLGETALAVAGGSHFLRFKLPTLEPTGETNLPAPAEWGPYVAGDAVLLATVDQKLMAMTAAGEARWQVPLEHGPLAGPPLVSPDGVLLAYRKGVLEKRSLADGKTVATVNVEHPLATGPVAFLQKIVVAASDGTLLVVDRP